MKKLTEMTVDDLAHALDSAYLVIDELVGDQCLKANKLDAEHEVLREACAHVLATKGPELQRLAEGGPL